MPVSPLPWWRALLAAVLLGFALNVVLHAAPVYVTPCDELPWWLIPVRSDCW